LLQSLVQCLYVAAEKRETERAKEKKQKKLQQFKKNLAAETEERTKDKKKREGRKK
jgi:hypothetical protein